MSTATASSTDTSTPTHSCSLCPLCGGEMHWRQNRTAKTWFQSCKKWPDCSGTRTRDGVDSRISPQKQNRMWAILKAAVLRSEDECLTFTTEDLTAADGYDLHLDEIREEKSFVLTVKKK